MATSITLRSQPLGFNLIFGEFFSRCSAFICSMMHGNCFWGLLLTFYHVYCGICRCDCGFYFDLGFSPTLQFHYRFRYKPASFQVNVKGIYISRIRRPAISFLSSRLLRTEMNNIFYVSLHRIKYLLRALR